MFGESEERVILALVPAVAENCVHELPPFRLYCHISDVAEEDAEIVKPLAVMLETEQDTVGAVRSMLFRVTAVSYTHLDVYKRQSSAYTPAYCQPGGFWIMPLYWLICAERE